MPRGDSGPPRTAEGVDIKTSRSLIVLMRTTLTIDEDNAVVLDRLVRQRADSLKSIVNEALRRGLREMSAPVTRSRKRSYTRPIDAGKFLIGNIDCIGEVIGMLDDEKYR